MPLSEGPAGEGPGQGSVEPSGSVALLLLLNAAFPFALIALPSSPIFGGTKHWMNALPFLCVLGAWAVTEGVVRALGFLRDHPLPVRWGSRALPAMVAVVALFVVTPGFWLTARVHPYGLGQYNSVVGFARGAANIGFQRTFWGHEPRLVMPLINDGVEGRGRIALGDTNKDDYNMYRRDGLLRGDLAYTGSVAAADVISVQPQGEFKDEWLKTLDAHKTGGPDHVVHIEGVPLLTVTFAP